MGGKLSRFKTSKRRRDYRVTDPPSESDGDQEHNYEDVEDYENYHIDTRSVKTEISDDSAFVDTGAANGDHSTPTCRQVSMKRQVDSNDGLPLEETGVDHQSAPPEFEDSHMLDDDVLSGVYNATFRKEFASGAKRLEYFTDDFNGQIQYMVEAFQPLIEGSVDATEVVTYMMTFIEHPEEIANKHKDSPKAAIAMLIAKTKESGELGKWQRFLEALEHAEYEYIAQLLRGQTERDNTLNRQLLKVFTPELVNRMDPLELIHLLYQKRVISETDFEEIKRENDNRNTKAASMMLLSRIPRKLSTWPEEFIEVLNLCGLYEFIDAFQEINCCAKDCTTPKSAAAETTNRKLDVEMYITPMSDCTALVPQAPEANYVRTSSPLWRGQQSSPLPTEQDQVMKRLDSKLQELIAKKEELECEVSKRRHIKTLEKEIVDLQEERLKLILDESQTTEDEDIYNNCFSSAYGPKNKDEFKTDTEKDSKKPNTFCKNDSENTTSVAIDIDRRFDDITEQICKVNSEVESIKDHFTREIRKLVEQSGTPLSPDAINSNCIDAQSRDAPVDSDYNVNSGHSGRDSQILFSSGVTTLPLAHRFTDSAVSGMRNSSYAYMSLDLPINLYDASRRSVNGMHTHILSPSAITALPTAHEVRNKYLDMDSAFCSYISGTLTFL